MDCAGLWFYSIHYGHGTTPIHYGICLAEQLVGRLALGVRNGFDSSLEASKSSAAKLEAPIHFFTTCAARCAAGDFVLFCESPTLFLGNLGLVAVQQALQLLAQAILSPFVCSTS